MSDENLAADQASSTAERIENMDSPEELDPLDVQVTCSLGSRKTTVTEVVLVLGTGGPHIELNATKGRVDVYWGMDSHSVPLFENEELCDQIHSRYAEQFREQHVS